MEEHVFRIFVNGRCPEASVRAMRTLAMVCRQHLPDRHRIIPIDIHVNPEQLRRYEVMAVPTIIREFPGPPVRVAGDLSNREVILASLGLLALRTPSATG